MEVIWYQCSRGSCYSVNKHPDCVHGGPYSVAEQYDTSDVSRLERKGMEMSSHLKRGVTGCPRKKFCPNTTGSIHCPGIDDPPDPATGDSGGCPFLVDHYAAAFSDAVAKVTTKVVAETMTNEVLAGTPGTPQHLNRKLVEREDRKKAQDKMAALLKWERQKRLEKILLSGGQVKLSRRAELLGYLPDADAVWPEGEPIATLCIGI